MFEKTLTDVVKGIRASKRDTALYISQCIAEIKTEINSSDMYVKSNALTKLTFLQMMGYGMSWASFACVEVMSSPRFAHKRIGYLAASQGFTQDTDVILLTTNLLKKELRGALAAGGGMHGVYEAGLAINCLSNIVTEDLARELLPDLTNLTSHPQPYLRKKSLLCLFKLFVKYPQGLRLTFARVQACLDDANPSVVSCAVNVVTELSDKNPRNYLHLAPAFFQLLTGSSNNWMLIKVVKLLGSLVAEEPRLARKLLEPLANIVRTTQAKSLLYEAVHTITLCLPHCRKSDGSLPPSVPGIVETCARTLRSFVEDPDQNLKYLGLVGFGGLASSHPRVLSDPGCRPLVLGCLSDDDETIRSRALGLLPGMATRRNPVELVEQLLGHVEAASGTYKSDLVQTIVSVCSADKYALLQDFAWYIDVLATLAGTRGIDQHGDLVARQFIDVALRVLPARSYAVRRAMEVVLRDGPKATKRRTEGRDRGDANTDGHVMPEVLPAAAWIVGEYSHLIGEALEFEDEEEDHEEEDDDEEERKKGLFLYDSRSKGTHHALIQALTAPSNVAGVVPSTQAVYVQGAMKVLAAAANNADCDDDELEACCAMLSLHLPLYMESIDVEVQERAFTLYHLLDSLGLLVGAAVGGRGNGAVPGLTRIEGGDADADGSSSDEDDDGRIGKDAVSSSDLLDLAMSPPSPATKTSPFGGGKDAFLGGLHETVASKCRNAATTLKYLLIPDPMKPVSAKAQRKKLQSPPPSLEVDLNKPVDLSVFAPLIAGELARRQGGEGKVSIETVSFTQQRPMRTSSVVDMQPMDLSPASPDGGDTFSELNGTAGGPGRSFQHSGMPPSGGGGASQSLQPRHHDPFYLNSGGQDGGLGEETSQQIGQVQGRFGTIQLLDSEGESDGAEGKRRKKKKKDRKQKKKGGAAIGEAGLAAFTGKASPLGAARAKQKHAADAITLYSSDEEEDASRMLSTTAIAGKKKNGPQQKEFEGLAKVDLTTPLREDEVMPRNEHRVVPERVPDETIVPGEGQRLGKKKKKKKKKRENKEKVSKKAKGDKGIIAAPTSNATGDLLDFGDLYSGMAQSTTATMAQSSPTNPISNAFDDLLGLETPSSPMGSALTSIQKGQTLEENAAVFLPDQTSSTTAAGKTSRKGGKRVWQKGSIKSSHAKQYSGSINIDWEQVSLHFKSYYHGKGASTSAMISLRVINHSSDMLLKNVVISLGGIDNDVALGDAEPGNGIESAGKVGPFLYSNNRSSFDVRGSISASGCTSPIKLSMPATMHLSPVSGLSQEDVFGELSSGHWAMHSVKLEPTSGLDAGKIKAMLCSFLRAEEVQGNSSSNGTLAAQASNGVKVRALVKVKQKTSHGTGPTVKVDIKCSDETLGKALSSDLKKVII